MVYELVYYRDMKFENKRAGNKYKNSYLNDLATG